MQAVGEAGGGRLRRPAVRQPVAEPDHVARSSPVVCSSAACAAARSTGHGRGCQPGRASSAAPAVSRCTAIPPSTPIGGGAVSSSSTSRPFALGLLQEVARDGDPLVPVLGRRPAIVDHQQQRAAAAQPRRGVEHGSGQGQDQQGCQRQTQQQQPPAASAQASARGLIKPEPGTETAGRRCAAEPAGSPAAAATGPAAPAAATSSQGWVKPRRPRIEHRQVTMRGASMRHQRQQCQSRRVRSVRWAVKRQPWRPAMPARLSRCAASSPS